MDTALFDFDLPDSLIAQNPVEPRDASRLLVLDRHTGNVRHVRFRQFPSFLTARDLLVQNDTRVMPVQLAARRQTGGRVELLLLRALDERYRTWTCLIRGAGMKPGRELWIGDPAQNAIRVRVAAVQEDGVRVIEADPPLDPIALSERGLVPLPPYIKSYQGSRERYQTVYARMPGSVAAPTAGLHFTPELLDQVRARTAGIASITLHVGRDTFAPVRTRQVENHELSGERVEIGTDTARSINRARAQGGRIVSVGTTTTRTLEWAIRQPGGSGKEMAAAAGWADLYIWPGFTFRAVDAMLTNFHLPRSTPLFMIAAFIGEVHADPDRGRRMLLETYGEATRMGYRFYSFGDAMLIL